MAKRKTLQELAAQSRANAWACPRCGCLDWRTINSYFAPSDGTRHRRQRCRNCNYTRMTWESTTPPTEDSDDPRATNGNRCASALTLHLPIDSDAANEHAGNEHRRSRAGRARA